MGPDNDLLDIGSIAVTFTINNSCTPDRFGPADDGYEGKTLGSTG